MCISVNYNFSSTAEDIALVNHLDVVGQVLLILAGISTYATEKCSFPNMLHCIVIVQLLP